MASPFLTLRYLEDLVASPLWVFSLGHAHGLAPKKMLHIACFAVLGAASQAGAEIAGDGTNWQCGLLGLGTICSGKAAFQITQGFTRPASFSNNEHFQLCKDMLALYWVVSMLLQCLSIAHTTNEAQQILEYGLLDLVLKLSGCHLLTKRGQSCEIDLTAVEDSGGGPR